MHGSDEKRTPREHKLSVKEQGDNSPRQQSPLPANNSGKKNTNRPQTANTQQPYGMQYGETGYPPRYSNPPYQYQHQQQTSANPRAYQGQTEYPDIQLPAPNMQDFSKPVENVT